MSLHLPHYRALLNPVRGSEDLPDWLLTADPLFQIDWQDKRAYLAGAAYYSEVQIEALFDTFSTPACLATGLDGSLYALPANSVHSFHMPVGMCRGQLGERAATNKCTHYNANPPALIPMGSASAFNIAASGLSLNVTAAGGDANTLFGIVDDSANMLTGRLAKLLLAGVLNGWVFKIDNSAGASFAYFTLSGLTGNTLPHMVSSEIRGSGNATATLGNTTAGVAVTAAYQRYSVQRTPANSIQTATLRVEPGGVGFFTLTVLEEGAEVTSPIVVAGASATRAASSLIAANGSPLAAALQASAGFFFKTDLVAGGTTPRLADFAGGARMNFFSATKAAIYNGATELQATAGSGTYAGVCNIAFGADGAGASAKMNSGVLATNAAAWAGNTGDVHLMRSAAGLALNGYMARSAGDADKAAFNGLAVAA